MGSAAGAGPAPGATPGEAPPATDPPPGPPEAPGSSALYRYTDAFYVARSGRPGPVVLVLRNLGRTPRLERRKPIHDSRNLDGWKILLQHESHN
jgi:hypothetical protein